MAFINKKDPTVINIKLTSKGRELLSKGNLSFKYFTIGDSEIDYSFISENNYDAFDSKILKPADKNPSILSYIPQFFLGEQYNVINNVPSVPNIIQNSVETLGFFEITTGGTIFKTTGDFVKQPDAMVKIDEVVGGILLNLYQAPTYLANLNEPEINDILLIKWTNPDSINTTGYTVSIDTPTPYLFYKIVDIASGTTLVSDNLIVTLDRELPDFGSNGVGVVAGAMIFNGDIDFNIEESFSTDFADDALLAFFENCQCPTIAYPFWNLSIVYTENIAGVRLTDKQYGQYNTNKYAGFISYIQNQIPIYKKLGIIHYTNTSPANYYAEELFQNTPQLDIPTIMWHKSDNVELGVKLNATGGVKSLTGLTKSLNTTYYDLADSDGNIVGKVFNDLKLFVIEDQEFLFAMSYKSNRSWTLPNYSVGTNDTIFYGCPECLIDFSVSVIDTTGTTGGSITIYDIFGNVGDPLSNKIILHVSGFTDGVIYFNTISGNTTIDNLDADSYDIKLIDLGVPCCEQIKNVIIN